MHGQKNIKCVRSFSWEIWNDETNKCRFKDNINIDLKYDFMVWTGLICFRKGFSGILWRSRQETVCFLKEAVNMFTSEVANDVTRFSLVLGNDLRSEPIYRRHERIIKLCIVYFYFFFFFSASSFLFSICYLLFPFIGLIAHFYVRVLRRLLIHTLASPSGKCQLCS